MTAGRLDTVEPPAPSGGRAEVLGRLAQHLLAVRPGGRAVVAVDGVDGAGKTVLGRELALLLDARREVHRVSVDGFHRPRAQRHARGRTPETFYRDSYDHAAVRLRLVDAFRSGRPWVTAVHDVEREVRLEPVPPPVAGFDALLLVDGIFLHRPELADLWDASVWVEVPFAVSVPRGNARFGSVGPARAPRGPPTDRRRALRQAVTSGRRP